MTPSATNPETLPAGPVLLLGPAGSGKTALALSGLNDALRGFAPPRYRILVPNQAARTAMLEQLRQRAPGKVLVGPPAVTTFTELADWLRDQLDPSPDTAGEMIAPFHRRLLLREIVATLQAERKLGPLGPLANRPGLITALDRAIAELKRAAVEPDALAHAIGTTSGKHHDLLAIYQAYQTRLLAENRYDLEGQMWHTRDLLAQASPQDIQRALSPIDSVLVLGFIDFTPTQRDLLRHLAAHVSQLRITLPLDPTDQKRDRLWQWTSRTASRLEETLGPALTTITLDPPKVEGLPATLGDRVFRYDAPPTPPPAGLRLIEAAGMDAEIAAVARRVKALLLDGTPGQQIALLARSLSSCRDTIERCFADAGIAIAPGDLVLGEVPIVQLCLDLAALPGKQFDHVAVLAVLKNSYLRPDVLASPTAAAFDESTRMVAEFVIREGNVLEGRASYAQAADRLARRDEIDDDAPDRPLGPLQPGPEAIRRAGALLETLFDLAQQATTLAGLRALPKSLTLAAAACRQVSPTRIARDLRALEKLDDILAQLEEAHIAFDPAVLHDLLGEETLPAPRQPGTIALLDVVDARSLQWDHVFLVGLSDGQFPARAKETTLLSEADRARWESAGVRLDRRDDLTAREMLLFYLGVTRARHSLTLTYQHAGANGSASAASLFLQTLLDALGGLDALRDNQAVETIAPGSFVLPEHQLATASDALRAVATSLLGDDPARTSAAAPWVLQHQPAALASLAAGAFTLQSRWQKGYDAFDGRLNDPTLQSHLAANYTTPPPIFSASRLNAMGRCPWQFFAESILHLRPLANPERQLEAVAKGTFYHDVLCSLLETLADQLGRPLYLNTLGEHPTALRETFDRVFAEQVARVETRQPPYPVLWTILQDKMRRELWAYLESLHDDETNPACLHFELSFGASHVDTGSIDPASQEDPILLETPAGPMRIKGRIDRVDQIVFEDQPGLLVVDYKTGKLPTPTQSGNYEALYRRNTQLPLYAAAAEAMLGQSCLGGVFQSIPTPDKRSYFATLKGSRKKTKPNDSYPKLRKQANETLGEFLTALRAGRFDLDPASPKFDDCRYCPYSHICCRSETRLERKRAREDSP